MTKTEFAGFIREHDPVILDGATGTNLMEAGMPIGVCPESWVLENPQVLLDLQRRYVEAGSHIVYASTFTGNRIKLEEYGLQERLEEINTQLVALSRQAVGDQALVAGDMTMTSTSSCFRWESCCLKNWWTYTRSRHRCWQKQG